MNVAVVGLGLIGGSFALAARRAGHCVWGMDPRVSAEEAGFGTLKLPDDLAEIDLVLLAVPPAAVVPWVEAQADHFKDGALVVDATGVKGTICAALRKFAYQDRWTFIGGHPMAGREVSGFANATPDLFAGASMILTPYPSCGRRPLERLDAFFRGLGFARVVTTTPEHHDEMIALTSQLAHVVSSAYIRDDLAREHAGYSAGSFHDMTRVARLDPAIWTDLFFANREALLKRLEGLQDRLGEYHDALAKRDAAQMKALLTAGRAARLRASGELPEA